MFSCGTENSCLRGSCENCPGNDIISSYFAVEVKESNSDTEEEDESCVQEIHYYQWMNVDDRAKQVSLNVDV